MRKEKLKGEEDEAVSKGARRVLKFLARAGVKKGFKTRINRRVRRTAKRELTFEQEQQAWMRLQERSAKKIVFPY